MKKSQQAANKSDRLVQFRHSDAVRIASAVHAYETARRDSNPSVLPRAVSSVGMRLGKTTSVWNKGSLATIELYENGTPPNETRNDSPYTLEGCVNKFADVPADKWVMVARANGYWYLIASECF